MSSKMKFKALDKRNNKVYYLNFNGYTTSKDEGGIDYLEVSFGDRMHDDFCHSEYVDDYILMQFTGLFDEKGEEIYEKVEIPCK